MHRAAIAALLLAVAVRSNVTKEEVVDPEGLYLVQSSIARRSRFQNLETPDATAQPESEAAALEQEAASGAAKLKEAKRAGAKRGLSSSFLKDVIAAAQQDTFDAVSARRSARARNR
eukprot:TRINITY_DN106000_c0_g1_i1.p1 TRINITY_DN106000_c0_g1~~TRINITY_DN106000_c0_g1_i1.p1  ORF type:complete len:117 (-),score=26.70 TRINITY_DN106000_c0_g1_i1:139-489(-)